MEVRQTLHANNLGIKMIPEKQRGETKKTGMRCIVDQATFYKNRSKNPDLCDISRESMSNHQAWQNAKVSGKMDGLATSEMVGFYHLSPSPNHWRSRVVLCLRGLDLGPAALTAPTVVGTWGIGKRLPPINQPAPGPSLFNMFICFLTHV